MVNPLTRVVALLALVCVTLGIAGCAGALAPRDRMTIIARGFHQPRAIAFGPTGEMYVSEAGFATPRDIASRETRDFTTGRISVVDRHGDNRTLLDNLPVRHYALANQLVGPAGLAVRTHPSGTQLFVAYGQCGAPECGGVLAVELTDASPATSPQKVADLQAIVDANPPPSGDTSAPEGETNPFGLAIGDTGVIYVADSSANHLVAVDRNAGDSYHPRIHARFLRNPVPTGVAVSPTGIVYVSLLGGLPHQRGNGQVVAVDNDGSVRNVASGLNAPIAVVADESGVYALELSSHFDLSIGEFVPRSGRVLRLDLDDVEPTVLADGLNFPTALAIGPDGSLYVAVNGAFSERGSGFIVRIAYQGE